MLVRFLLFVLGATVVACGLFLPSRSFAFEGVPARLIAFVRWLILFRGETVERTSQVLVVSALFLPALVLSPLLIALFQQRRWTATRKVIGASLISAFLVVVGAVAAWAVLPKLKEANKWLPFPSLSGLLPAAIAGACLFGITLLGERWVARLLTAFGAAFLLLATLHIWIDHFHDPWFISSADIHSLEWKLPLLFAGSVPLAIFVARQSSDGRSKSFGRFALVPFICCVAIFLAPFRFRELWDITEVGRVAGAHLAPNGDLFLLAYKRGFENDLSYGDAVLVRAHDQTVLRCLSRRPFALSLSTAHGSPLVSPDGQHVAMTEFATPWESLAGAHSYARIRSVDGKLAAVAARIPRENAPEEGRGDRLVLGPSGSWALPMQSEIIGNLVDGNPFRVAVSGSSGGMRLWIFGNTLRIFRNVWSDGGRAKLVDLSLESGILSDASIPLAEPAALTSVSPDGREMVVETFLPSNGERQQAYWINGESQAKSLGAATRNQERRWRIPGAPAGSETVVWRQSGPIRVGGYADVRDVAGRLLALTVPGTHISASTLVELDETAFKITRILAGAIEQTQFLSDSVVYLQSARFGRKSYKVMRYWPATGRTVLLFATPTLN